MGPVELTHSTAGTLAQLTGNKRGCPVVMICCSNGALNLIDSEKILFGDLNWVFLGFEHCFGNVG